MSIKSKSVKVTYTKKWWRRNKVSSYRTEIKYDTRSYKLEDKNKREIMRELLKDPLVLSVKFEDIIKEEGETA